MTQNFYPDPFLFVDEDGKMARNKYMADTKEHKGSQFTLVYSEMSSWDKFVASSSKASKADPLSTFYIVSKVPKVTKKMKFDALMWVRSELVSDVPMERWYLLLEIYQNPKLKLHQYLHPKPAAANKDKQDSQDNVSSSKPSKSRCSGTPPPGTSNSRCSGAPNDNPGGPVDAPSENMDGDVNVPILTSNPVTTCSGSGDTNSVKSNSKFNFKRVGVAPEKFVKEKESKNTVKNTNVIERLFTKFLEDVHPEMPSDFISLEEKDIPDLVSEFFMMLQKNEEQSYNESTLLTYYYSLSRLFLEKKNIVVKNNPLFEGTRKVLRAQQKVSRENGEIPGKNASRAIPPEVLAKCWEKEVFGKKDPQTLQATVLLNHQIYFGVRAKKETVDTRVGDVSCGPLRSDGLPQYLEYSERVTKTRTGATGQGARESIPRMYPDDARPDRCPVRLFDFFMSKKPAEARKPDFRLFVNALNITKKKWEDCDVWYAAAPMGHNTIGGLIKKQLEAAGINTKDLKLTGTSVR